jgi:hypothetical protein
VSRWVGEHAARDRHLANDVRYVRELITRFDRLDLFLFYILPPTVHPTTVFAPFILRIPTWILDSLIDLANREPSSYFSLASATIPPPSILQ